MTIDGEEKILANAAATITESNNMKITAPDGTVSYAKTVTIDANGYVIEKGYSVTVTVDGEPQFFKAVGQQKTLPTRQGHRLAEGWHHLCCLYLHLQLR